MRPNGMQEKSYDSVMRSPWRASLLRGRPQGEQVFALITPAIRKADAQEAAKWRESLIANGTIMPLQSRPTYRTDFKGREAAALDILTLGRDFAIDVMRDSTSDPEVARIIAERIGVEA